MQIHVPEDLGGKLRVLPVDVYDIKISDIFIKPASTGSLQAYIKATVRSEFSGKKGKDYQSTVGEPILTGYNLQEQSLWRLNQAVVEITGDKIPHGDWDKESFEQWLKDNLVGWEGKATTENETTNKGTERTVIASFHQG